MEDDPFQSLGIGNALDVHFPANDPQFPAPTNQFGCENDLNQWPHLQMRHQQSGINTDDLDPNPMNVGIPEPPSNFRSKIGIPYKSQPCFLFQRGDCYYGSNCHFAHGVADLKTRPPIEILEDNRRIINQMRLCKRFVNVGECPNGDQCQFLHQSLEKMKGDLSNDELHPRCSTKNLNQKPLFWKTRMCKKWEATGYCPYGIKCCFAHGLAELNTLKTQTKMDSGNLFTVTQTTAATVNDSSSGEAGTENGCKKFLFKWTDVQKIGRIYADWIDDNRITSFC